MGQRIYSVGVAAQNVANGLMRMHVYSTCRPQTSDADLRAVLMADALTDPHFRPSDGWTFHLVQYVDTTDLAMTLAAQLLAAQIGEFKSMLIEAIGAQDGPL